MDWVAKGFPPDVIIDILSRLPLKSLVRFRSVSKPWLILITHSRFPYWLLNRNLYTHTPTSLILCYGEGAQTRFFLIGGGHSDDSFEVAKEIQFPPLLLRGNHHHHHHHANNNNNNNNTPPLKSSFEIKSSCCHGMLCLSVDDDALLLWNPSIRGYKVLPLPSDTRVCSGVCGLGFDTSMDDYKVVSLSEGQALVFSVKKNLWKIIGEFAYHLFNDGVSTNGCLYWAAGTTNTVADRILRLDLAEDVFSEVSLPPSFRNSPRGFDADDMEMAQKRELRLLLKDGLLCVFREFDQSLWTMKEEKDNNGGGIRETWSKLMTIPKFRNRERHFQIPAEFRIYHKLYPKCFTKSGNLLFSVKGEKFVMYIPEELDYRVLRIHGLEDGRYTKVIAYNETLISPESVRGMNDID